MSERLTESTWLYNQPLEGIVKNWWDRNLTRLRQEWGDPWILGTGFILSAAYETWDGAPNDRFTREQVFMTKDGLSVPVEGTELWQLWQEYTTSEAARDDFNGSKLHLNRYSRVLTDTNLKLSVSQYDWHRMRTLGMGLRDGVLPNGQPFPNQEQYQDGILPVRTTEGYIFPPENHPNNIVVQAAVITADNQVILTKKPKDADYYPDCVSASIEEQMHGQRDNSPFDTLERSIGKIGGEELKLTLIPSKSRLAAMVLEIDCNAIALIMTARVEETSDQIDATNFGPDRAEFDPTYSARTLPLDRPETLVNAFHDPNFKWHGLSKIRLVAALSEVHGYQEALDLLYRGYQTA